MTHHWIQTWQGLCVYYITRHWAHLSFITYIAPPHQEGEKGEREGNIYLDPSYALRLLFPPGQTDTPPSAPHHTARLSLSFFFFTPLLPFFCAGNLLDITTPQLALEHPGRSCPQGFLGRYQKHTGHSSLPASHMNGLCCVDVRIIDKCNLDVFYLFLGLFVMMSLNQPKL